MKSEFSTNAQARFEAAVFDGALGPQLFESMVAKNCRHRGFITTLK